MPGESRIDGETDLHDGNLTWRTASSSPIVLGAAVFVGCLALSPREVNGDGIGYLKAVHDGALYPGHLLYVPLLRGVCRLFRATTLLECVLPCRMVSALGAAIASVCVASLAERRWIVGAGFALSAGMMGAGCDVESYAPAVAAILATAVALRAGRDGLAGVLLALAVLLHIENALFALPALLLSRRRVRMSVVAAATFVIVAVALGARPSSLPQASHGFRYPLHVYTPAIALWGALRTLVFAPYPYEAPWWRVIAPAIVATGIVRALEPSRMFASRTITLAWLVPYSIVGLCFFSSDPERWLFVLPLFWLAVRPRLALVAVLGAINLVLWLPHVLDGSATGRARAASSVIRGGDLVLMPGHGWDESIALYAPDARTFPLVYHAAARGGVTGLGDALDEALRTSGRVVSVRLDDDSPLGWKELAPFGIDRASVPSILSAHGLVPGADKNGVREWIRSR